MANNEVRETLLRRLCSVGKVAAASSGSTAYADERPTASASSSTAVTTANDVAATLCGKRLDLTGTARTDRRMTTKEPVCSKCVAGAARRGSAASDERAVDG